jgi:hypothetical protein
MACDMARLNAKGLLARADEDGIPDEDSRMPSRRITPTTSA